MKAYLQAFVNFNQNDWTKLLLIVKFAYNNTKNLSTNYTPFELNCSYYLCIFFEENTNPRSQSKSTNELSAKLRDPMTICRKNLHNAQAV